MEKKIPDPTSIQEAASKNYIDKKCKDPSVTKNAAHVDINDKKLDKVGLVKVISLPAVRERSTPKDCVEQVIDEVTLMRTHHSST